MSISAKGSLTGDLGINRVIKGIDGVSPVVTVEEIDNGHRVVITDAEGVKSFDIENGKDGATGEQGPIGPAGPHGQPGVDGKTPVKGEDYFTPTEIQEIAAKAAGMVDLPENPGGGSGSDVSDSDTIELLAEMGIVDPVSAENGAVYTDTNNKIYVL